MRTLAFTVAILLGSTAVAQELPVVISELYEYKLVVAVGPIEATVHGEEIQYNVSKKTEIEVEKTAEYGCSIYGRQSYPINVSNSDGCLELKHYFLDESERYRRSLQGCMKYYLYACGTH